MDTGIFKIFNYFSRIWRIGDKYKADRIGERANSWPTPILTLKKGEEKLFQKYLVFLPIK